MYALGNKTLARTMTADILSKVTTERVIIDLDVKLSEDIGKVSVSRKFRETRTRHFMISYSVMKLLLAD